MSIDPTEKTLNAIAELRAAIEKDDVLIVTLRMRYHHQGNQYGDNEKGFMRWIGQELAALENKTKIIDATAIVTEE